MKTCRLCRDPFEGRGLVCNGCRAARQRKRYRDNPEARAAKNAAQEARRQRKMRVLFDHLASHPCVDCGEPDPIVLEFDHVRGQKIAGVSEMVCRGFPIKKILAEIEKCEIRCANCHRRQSARRGGWFSYLANSNSKP